MLMKYFLFTMSLSLLFQLATTVNIDQNLVQFKSNSTTCAMFSKSCKIEIFLKKKLNLNSLQVNPYKTKFYKFLRMQLCRTKSGINDCSVKLEKDEENDVNSLNTAFIYIDAIIVGKTQLFLNYNFTNDDFVINDKMNDEDSGENEVDHNRTNVMELTTSYYLKHDIIISSPQRILDKIHMIYVIIFQTIVSVFMGLLLDVKAIVKIIKMPIPVVIGFVSQYIFMPLLAFSCVKIFSLPSVDALALFIYGCCPGGSASNNWTILLNGDIDLSAIMTFVSTLGSLVLMPAWLYSLGRVFTSAANITIPFSKLVLNLFTTIIPCLIGLSVSRCFPKIKPIILKISKPLILFVVITFFLLTLYVKYYVIYLVKWKQWLVAPLIPWFGFIISSLIALCAKLPKNQVLTIAIETGIQNVGIAFLIIFSNFPSPESDYAILPLISVTTFTTIPLWFYLMIKIIRDKKKFCLFNKKENEENGNEEIKFEPVIKEADDENNENSKFNVQTKINIESKS